MAKRYGIYKCEICGNIVEVLHEGMGDLVCCEKPMVFRETNTVDAATEKHVPVIEKINNDVKVTVGSVAHPMTEDHFIEWIELYVNDQVLRQDLKPGMEPVAIFKGVAGENVSAREYCNLHGLWKG